MREALDYAGNGNEPDCASGRPNGVVTIVVPPGCYRLAGTLPVFQSAASLVTGIVLAGGGQGPAGCTGAGSVIDGQSTGSVLVIFGFTVVTVSGLTITGGLGGGIVNSGTLSLTGVTITGNTAAAGADQSTPGTGAAGGAGDNGGGISNLSGGQLTVARSEIVGNAAGAGGAGSDGSGNKGGPGGAGGSGGGIYNLGGIVSVIDSTVSGNAAGAGGIGGIGDPNATPATAGGPGGSGGNGGGIASLPDVPNGRTGRLTVTNSTVADNVAGAGGGGGLGSPGGPTGTAGGGGGIRATDPAQLTNVTVAGNSAAGTGDGIDAAGGAVSEYGSVIAANGAGADAQNCVGAITDDAYNVTYPVEAFSDCPGVIADPKLGSLALHGGGLPTVPLGAGGSAIDIEPPGGACPASDERGVARPKNGRCDAGAYESAPPQLANLAVAADGPTTATVSATVDGNLQDTSVVARYGTTTAHGVSSHTVDAGAGNGPVAVPVTGLAPSTTYHVELEASNADGTVTSTDMTLTTATGPPSGGGRGSVAPVITNVRQSARRWLAGRTLATLTRGRAIPVGTTFTFGLDQNATVTLTFTRLVPGRVVKRQCRAPSRRNRHGPRCTRALAAGMLVFSTHVGTNLIRFYGRLSRRAQLTPGNYVVDIGASNAAGRRSVPQHLSFTIVRP